MWDDFFALVKSFFVKVERLKRVYSWGADFPWQDIELVAGQVGLDPKIVAALVRAESAGDRFAMRYEPNWKYQFNIEGFSKELKITQATEFVMQSTSWGLMQVMGSVAREHVFLGPLPKLCEARVGLYYGCLHFQKFLKRYGEFQIEDSVSAYNQGDNRKVNGIYRNQVYVDRVMDYYRELA